MKLQSLIFAVVAGLGLQAMAAQVQTITNLQVAFGCDNDKVVMSGEPTLNYYTSNHGGRFENFGTNQLFLDGQELVIQASSGDRTVLGTLSSVPTCTSDDPGNTPAQYHASWNSLKVAPQVTITETITDDVQSCKASGYAAGGYLRTSNFKLAINDPAVNHIYNQNWNVQTYFQTLAQCQMLH